MSGHVVSAHPSLGGESFRSRLRAVFAARCQANARYTLRAFANFLGIDHASLSQLLRGVRPATATTIRQLGARIGLTAGEIQRCIAYEKAQPALRESIGSLQQLAEDTAHVLGDWRALAILELMRLEHFRPDVGWIARSLAVTPEEVQLTLQHLLRLGLLAMRGRQWVDLTGGRVYRESDLTLLLLERLANRSHEAKLASARLDTTSPRVHGSLVVAITESTLPTLISAAEAALRQASTVDGGAAAAARALYHVEVHCYPAAVPDPTEPTPET